MAVPSVVRPAKPSIGPLLRLKPEMYMKPARRAVFSVPSKIRCVGRRISASLSVPEVLATPPPE
jgi:hypothetical protein